MKKTQKIDTKKIPVWFRLLASIYFYAFKMHFYLANKTMPGRFSVRIYNIIAIQCCIWEAKSLHKLTNQQYYVLKVFGKVRVMSTRNINYNRRKRTLSKSLDFYKLQELCIFKTK